MVEIAQIGCDMLLGKLFGFKNGSPSTNHEDNKGKKLGGKLKAKDKEHQRTNPYRSAEERKELMANNQCFLCKKVGHRSKECPYQTKKKEELSKAETETTRKKKSFARLIPYVIGDTAKDEA